jgi:hypothetical protein
MGLNMQISNQFTTELAEKAVTHFWTSRDNQSNRQLCEGRTDQGYRGAVTGGAQMNGFIFALQHLAILAGVPESAVYTKRRLLELPGFYRPTKEWDLLIVHEKTLMAAVEAKSQVGPSFGNNFNNRTEEAMGSALDFWTAFRENAFIRTFRPWLGYIFLLEDCMLSQRQVSVREPHFKVFPEFQGSSYSKRYELFCKRLVLERQYDATAFLMSKRDQDQGGSYSEPCLDLGFHHFAISFVSHLKGCMS